MDRDKIAKTLQELREKKGISQHELADAIGVSDSAISAYESGERIPRDEIKVKLASFYKKSIVNIFFANK